MSTLILPATQGRTTRKSIASGEPPKGYAELDFLDFLKRMSSHYSIERRMSAIKSKQERANQKNRHALRPFFPQAGMKIERADTNVEMQARGELYLTMSNGMVVRPNRIFAKGRNPALIGKVFSYLEEQKTEEQK